MAIPAWEHCLQQVRRDPIRMAAVGVAVGAGCLFVGLRSSNYAVTVHAPGTQARSGQAIRQVSQELDIDVESNAPRPVNGQPRLRSVAGNQVVPAIAFVESSGAAREVRKVEWVGHERTASSSGSSPQSRPAGPVRLSGTIENVD